MPLPDPLVGDPSTQRNFDHLDKRFPVKTADIMDDAVTGAKLNLDVQRDVSTAALTLTTAMQDVPGVSITVAKTGSFKATMVFDFNITVTGVGNCLGEIRNTTTGVSYQYAIFASNSIGRATVVQTATFTATAGNVLVLRASKSIAAGTATAAGSGYDSLLIEQYA